MTQGNSALDDRRKQILYRSNHRGIREMDIILGGYATRNMASLSEEDLAALESLMEESDRDLLVWFTGEQPVPETVATPLFARILEDCIAHGALPV